MVKQEIHEEIFNKIMEAAIDVDSKHFGSIYRVVKEVRMLKKSAYAPQLVSIGPLHSKDEHILNSPMQNVKMSYVNVLLCRVAGDKFVVFSNCVNKMEELIDRAKKCYAEKVEELNREMLVIDGCFILELLYRHFIYKNAAAGIESSESSNSKSNTIQDPIFDSPQTYANIQTDLLLLENQLPFFVLDELFRLTIVNIRPRPLNLSLIDYVLSFFGKMWIFESKGRATPERSFGEVNYYHILHILHRHSQPSERQKFRVQEEEDDKVPLMMPCASELESLGVEFCPRRTGGDLFMIDFHKSRGLCKWFFTARFQIPTFFVGEFTVTFLRNLVDFEQSCPDVPFYFTSYAFFMDKLINTPKDVEVLEKAGVIGIITTGAKEEASDLFNELCKGVILPLNDFYFAKTCKAVAKTCEDVASTCKAVANA